MATLRYSQIRAHPGGTINYIANKDKMISSRVHDVYSVLNYMGEPESTERVYSFGHHCSANPALAEKQIALHRARYFESKKGGIQGATGDNAELLGLHFFMSYTEEDDPTEETMNEILNEIANHPKLNDFAVFGANHFDKTHKHTHFFVSQYSAEGKPRKLCLRKNDYNDIRRFANRLCVERGLSIIDLPVLRQEKEYADWLDRVIADNQITVHQEREEHKKIARQRTATNEIYWRWRQEQEEQMIAEEKLLTEAELRSKRVREKYFFSFDGSTVYPVRGQQRRFHSVKFYDDDGRRRTNLELIIILLGVIIENQMPQEVLPNSAVITARPFWEGQKIADELRTARELSIEEPGEIPARIADVGKQMNALKQERRRHEQSMRKHEEIIEAWIVCAELGPQLESSHEPATAAQSDFKNAYAVLAANQVLTPEAYDRVLRRYDFERQKTIDYDKKMDLYRRQYRSLKSLEAVALHPLEIAGTYYSPPKEKPGKDRPELDKTIGECVQLTEQSAKEKPSTAREPERI